MLLKGHVLLSGCSFFNVLRSGSDFEVWLVEDSTGGSTGKPMQYALNFVFNDQIHA